MAAKTVNEYIAASPDAVKDLLQATRELILATLPSVQEYMKWGAPAYGITKTKQICYLYGGKDHVNFGFIYGAQLDDPKGLLLGKGTKDSRHVQLESLKDLKKTALKRFLRDSARLAS